MVDDGEKREWEEVAVGRKFELVVWECKNGVVYLSRENEVLATIGTDELKKFLIDYAYDILKNNTVAHDLPI